ncbi:MAG TPA: acylglycerol kinase family protein [Candidatus Saccharimonadia bacterium]|jgi:hypothetical protein
MRYHTSKQEHATWTDGLTGFLYVYNPKATNYRQAEQLATKIHQLLGPVPKTDIDITSDPALLKDFVAKSSPAERLLVCIAGGDGTVSWVVNTLADTATQAQTAQLIILPLWGGNANDLACMLNGLRMLTKPQNLLTASAAIPIPLIQVHISGQDKERSFYACCYVSFGATAYAARQLNHRRLSAHPIMRQFPPLLVVREIVFVAGALLNARISRVELDETEQTIYEHSLVNGPRIAKINRLPVSLSEPYFFHAHLPTKDPTIFITLVRILLRRPARGYSKRQSLSFRFKNPIDGQVDGEVIELAAGTRVTAQVAHTPLLFVSTQLDAHREDSAD